MMKKRRRKETGAKPPLKFKLRMAQNVVYLSKNSLMKSFLFFFKILICYLGLDSYTIPKLQHIYMDKTDTVSY